MISCEMRPFKRAEQIGVTGVTRPESVRRNPNGIESLPKRRDFKQLVFVAGTSDSEEKFCTTRYVDVDGTELWQKDHGATVTGVAIDDDGNTYECGAEANGITLRKRGPDGAQLWSRKTGADLNCCALSAGGIAVGGLASGGAGQVRKYDADGNLVWTFATAAPVIEVACDSSGNVAALDAPALVWNRVLYAIDGAGTLIGTQNHGLYVSDNFYNWPAGIAFTGVPEANTGWFDDGFSLYINNYSFDLELGFVTRNVGYTWGASAGYPDATYGTGLGDIFTHSSAAGPEDFLPMYGAVHRSTVRGLSTFVRALNSATFANTRLVTGPESWDQVGGGLGLCSRPGYIWVAGVSLFRYSEILPHPASGRWWNEFPDWSTPHGGTIRSCEANSSNVSILGGVRVPVI